MQTYTFHNLQSRRARWHRYWFYFTTMPVRLYLQWWPLHRNKPHDCNLILHTPHCKSTLQVNLHLVHPKRYLCNVYGYSGNSILWCCFVFTPIRNRLLQKKKDASCIYTVLKMLSLSLLHFFYNGAIYISKKFYAEGGVECRIVHLHLAIPGTEASCTWLSSGVGLSMA